LSLSWRTMRRSRVVAPRARDSRAQHSLIADREEAAAAFAGPHPLVSARA
jgi:hypothetical protein